MASSAVDDGCGGDDDGSSKGRKESRLALSSITSSPSSLIRIEAVVFDEHVKSYTLSIQGPVNLA